MRFRTCIVICLLASLLATRLLDVHFHLPAATSGESPHLVTLIEAHQHEGEPDHGHIAGHLYEGETDEDEGAAILAKLVSTLTLCLPLLLAWLWLARRSTAFTLLPCASEVRQRPRRWPRFAPPSQGPPLLA